MHTQSLRQLINALHSKQISSYELITHYLHRIKKAQHLNAFITVDEEYALAAAHKADKLLQKGNANSLTGIPYAQKDNFCTVRMPTTCASKMLANFQAPYNATVVERLQDTGTILLGKTNMDEFAMGSTNESSYFGPVNNPWNHDYVPGGSSGGSSAAVAAGLIPFATGTDTGGSIRQPAAFCNVSGIKPTYGLVSRFGIVAYASSLDQAGLFARSAEDLAITLQIIAGFDQKDSTSSNHPVPNYLKAIDKPIESLRIGIPSYFYSDDIDPDIRQALFNAIDVFKQLGATISDIELPLQSLWTSCYYIIACAEASSNLARFDGIRYGYRTPNATTLHDLITHSRSEAFGKQVKSRILSGTYMLSSEHYEAYYVHAQKIRRMIKNEFETNLSKVDIILSPTTPTCAFKLHALDATPIKNALADVFTVSANLAGLPAMSIPAGFSKGLPIGMQLIGNYFQESALLQIAHHYQTHTQWHQQMPSIGDDQ